MAAVPVSLLAFQDFLIVPTLFYHCHNHDTFHCALSNHCVLSLLGPFNSQTWWHLHTYLCHKVIGHMYCRQNPAKLSKCVPHPLCAPQIQPIYLLVTIRFLPLHPDPHMSTTVLWFFFNPSSLSSSPPFLTKMQQASLSSTSVLYFYYFLHDLTILQATVFILYIFKNFLNHDAYKFYILKSH